MKKIVLMLAMVAGTAYLGHAQIKLPVSAGSVLKNFVAPPSFSDPVKTATGIADLLGGKLALTPPQKKSTLEEVAGFLTQKQGIMGLAKSNPASYAKQFGGLQSGLFGKLKTIMGAAKFAKMLGMKPSGKAAAASVLGNLFF